MDISEIESFHKKVILTSIGSTVEVCIQHPLTIIKNEIQNNMTIKLSVRQLYSGVYTNIGVSAFLVSSQYLLYDFYNNHTKKICNRSEYISSFACGITLSTIINPLELYTIQKCKQFNQKTSFEVAKCLIQKNKLHHGYSMCASRELLFSAGLLVINPTLKNYLDNNYTSNLNSVGSSILSGTITSILSHPFDTIKSRMQYDLNKNLVDICKEMKVTDLFKGCGFRTTRNIGSFFIIMNTNNLLKQYFI